MKNYHQFILEIADSSFDWEKASPWNSNLARAYVKVFDPKRNKEEKVEALLVKNETREDPDLMYANLPLYATNVWKNYYEKVKKSGHLTIPYVLDAVKVMSDKYGISNPPDLDGWYAQRGYVLEAAVLGFQEQMEDADLAFDMLWDRFCSEDTQIRQKIYEKLDDGEWRALMLSLMDSNTFPDDLPDPDLWAGRTPEESTKLQKQSNLGPTREIEKALNLLYYPLSNHLTEPQLMEMQDILMGHPSFREEVEILIGKKVPYALLSDDFLEEAIQETMEDMQADSPDQEEYVSVAFEGSAVNKMQVPPVKLIRTLLEIIGTNHRDFRNNIYQFFGSHSSESFKAHRTGRSNAIGQRHRIYGKILRRPEIKTLLASYGLVPLPDVSGSHFIVARGYEDAVERIF